MSGENPHYFRTPSGPVTTQEIVVTLTDRQVRVRTAGGVFSADRLDPGTQVLLQRVPPPSPGGHLLDLGCGWGPVALTLGLAAPEATVWAVDTNDVALELTGINAGRLGLTGIRPRRPEDVPAEVRFATVWSNPPIRIGKPALHELLSRWLPRLEPGGAAYLVVQRHLGADSLHRWLATELVPGLGTTADVERLASARGYRVLRVTR
jgi:16S rRNA G1207 methylase RsmC